MTSESNLRIVIAVTETSPIAKLWEAAMKLIGGASAELVVLFLHDERWHRAASLPFTREFSLAGAADTDFTPQRAEELLASTVTRLRKSVDELAAGAGLTCAFQVVSELDEPRARSLLTAETSAVVGPAGLASHPLFVEFRGSKRRLILIDSGGQADSAG